MVRKALQKVLKSGVSSFAKVMFVREETKKRLIKVAKAAVLAAAAAGAVKGGVDVKRSWDRSSIVRAKREALEDAIEKERLLLQDTIDREPFLHQYTKVLLDPALNAQLTDEMSDKLADDLDERIDTAHNVEQRLRKLRQRAIQLGHHDIARRALRDQAHASDWAIHFSEYRSRCP